MIGLNPRTGSFFASVQIGNSWTGPLALIRLSVSGFYRWPIRIDRPRLEILDWSRPYADPTRTHARVSFKGLNPSSLAEKLDKPV